MAVLKITDLVDKSQIEDIKELDRQLGTLSTTFKGAAMELAKGLKIKIEAPKDLDKLYNLYNSQAKVANETTQQFASTLEKEKAILMEVASQLEKQAASGNLSTKQMKELSDATQKNAQALERIAKAEAAAERAQQTSNRTRKNATLSEEERKRVIKEAIELSKQEVHSINEANEVNKKLREAVKMVKTTDEDYLKTLGQLNGAIGVNTDLVRRNSDRYTQQKMNIGNYTDSIKRAYIELRQGNNTMRNMGIIAQNSARILGGQLSMGLDRVRSGVTDMIKGFVGAQGILRAISSLVTLFKDGVSAAIDFESANSKLAAILGTTSKNIKELESDARRLGASTRYTASQVTSLQIELAKLGFTRNEILQSTESVLKFAQATGAELGEAAALAGASIRMFGADVSETERYVSAMAVATTKSALDFSKLATSMPIVGPVAKAFNFTIEDTLALLAKLSDAGFDASMAATATRNIFLNLANDTGKLATALGGPVKTLPELVEGLNKLRKQGVDLNATLEMTDKRSVAAFNAFLTASDKILPLRDAITDVTTELTNMADTMADNVQGSIFALSSAWESFMLALLNSKGVVKDVLDFLAEGVRNVANDLKDFDQQQEDANNKAVTRAQKEMNKSTYVAEHEKKMRQLYKNYLNEGMSADEAAATAKQEYIERMQRLLMTEQNNYDSIILKRKELEAAYDKIVIPWSKAGKAYKAQIEAVTTEAAGAKALASITQSAIDQLNNVQLTGVDWKTGMSTSSTEKGNTAEQAAKERQKIQEELQQSYLDLMEDGQEKEIQALTNAYNKRMATIKGSSEEENQLRLNLAELLQRDIQAVEDKYADERKKRLEEQAMDNVSAIADRAAVEQAALTQEYKLAMLELDKQAIGADDEGKQAIEDKKFALTQRYARESAEAVISSLEEQLNVENLTADERERIHEELMKAKNDLALDEAQMEIDAIKRVEEAEEKSKENRIKKLKEWLNMAGDAIGAIGDMMSSIYEGHIEDIEKAQEANEDAGAKELERIARLEETGAITKEEAEARKRAAEESTAQRNEQLERRKVEIQRRQAMWDKATQLAQAGISTALAITEALPNLFLAALVGAMGAVQIATIASTPIPAYAEGTKDGSHPGGAALVGDGGKHELVMFNGKAWLTPDTPTLVDLPRGAKVFPDADRSMPDWGFAELASSVLPIGGDNAPVIINDYSRLERKMSDNNELMLLMLKYFKSHNSDIDFEIYKQLKL